MPMRTENERGEGTKNGMLTLARPGRRKVARREAMARVLRVRVRVGRGGRMKKREKKGKKGNRPDSIGFIYLFFFFFSLVQGGVSWHWERALDPLLFPFSLLPSSSPTDVIMVRRRAGAVAVLSC